MSYQFNRGTVVSIEYVDTFDGLSQLIEINSNNKIYQTMWNIADNNDLYGKGDKVSFLVNEDLVVSLRLNPFA